MGACRHPHFLRRNDDADVVNSRGDMIAVGTGT